MDSAHETLAVGIIMKNVDTFTATIWVGLKDRDTGEVLSIEVVEKVCQEYCDEVGLCVTVTPTRFIYTDGNGMGAAIGFINYPRFPNRITDIKAKAFELAQRLMINCKQYRVSIVIPDKTIMMSNPEKNHDSS